MPVTYQSAAQVLNDVKKQIFDPPTTDITTNYSKYCAAHHLSVPNPSVYGDPDNAKAFEAFELWAETILHCPEIPAFLRIRSDFMACAPTGDWEIIFLEVGNIINDLNLPANVMSELRTTYAQINEAQPVARPRSGGMG